MMLKKIKPEEVYLHQICLFCGNNANYELVRNGEKVDLFQYRCGEVKYCTLTLCKKCLKELYEAIIEEVE